MADDAGKTARQRADERWNMLQPVAIFPANDAASEAIWRSLAERIRKCRECKKDPSGVCYDHGFGC